MQQKEFNRWSLFLFLYCNQDSRFIYFAAYKVPVWVSRQPSPRRNYSASPPMRLMTTQSLPPSSASSVIIMSHSIDFAGLARRKNSLTLHCSLTWNSNQNDKFSPPYPHWFSHKTSQPPTHPRIGLSLSSLLTPNKTASPVVFFFRLHCLENLAGTF